MHTVIIYQVLPRLWGEGKFSSFDGPSLKYIKSLGTDYIWYTGVPRHATGESFVKGDPGSPYAVCDWFDTNPYLAEDPDARLQEFRALLERTRREGMKSIVDFIPNHVACNYRGGLSVLDWHDGDWTDTLKVDWSAEQTRQEFVSVLKFWAGMGVDGFRCDMVELVPADALGSVIREVKRDFPDLLFVAEVYGRENYGRYIREVGFDLLYDKSGSYDILRAIMAGNASARSLTWNWQGLGPLQDNMLNFLENHDEQRLCSPYFASEADRTWAALAYSMLFNGASFMLYAGQEMGEDASEGSEGRTSIFNWCRPVSLAHIWRYTREGKGPGRKEIGILSRYRELCKLKSRSLFRSGGVWDLCYCNEDSPGFNPDRMTAFARYENGRAAVVLCNFSESAAEVQLRIPEELRRASGITAVEVRMQCAPCGFSLWNCG